MQITVEKLTPTKSGKGYMLKAAGIANAYYTRCLGIEQTTGKTLDVVEGAFTPPGGTSVKTIESFDISSAQSASGLATSPQGASSQVDRFYMPFVSNVVAHAIQSGLILQPEHIDNWARAAKNAADGLERKSVVNLDSDVPF